MSLLLSTTSLLRPAVPSWLETMLDNLSSVRVIDLTHPRIDDVNAKIFANALDENQTVDTLILSCSNIVDDGAYAIGSVLSRSSRIQKLQLKDLRNSREVITFFQLLRQNSSLTELSLRHCLICQRGAVAIADFLSSHNQILEFRLTDTQFVCGASFKLVCDGLKKNTSVQRAYFVNNELVGEEAATYLVGLLEGSGLRALHLGENDLGDEGAAVLARGILKLNTALRFLDLRSNGITAAGAMSLQGLVINSQHLLGLDLSNNELGDLGAQAMARGLQHSSCLLQTLDLSFNQIDEAAAKALAAMLRTNKTLQKLNLSFNNLGDQGVRLVVSALLRNGSLRLLDLRRNGITNEGAMSVASYLPKMHGLKELMLSKNEISQRGATALLEGLRQNVELRHLNVDDTKLAESIARKINYYSRLNVAGRRILLQTNKVPIQIWTSLYSRVSGDKDVVSLGAMPSNLTFFPLLSTDADKSLMLLSSYFIF